MSTAADRVGEILAELYERVETLERRPVLARASIEGDTLDVYDDDVDHNLRQTIGKQPDNTYTVVDTNGPPPPMPSGITVDAGIESVNVTWSGSAAAPLPADFRRVAVHMSKIEGFTPTEATEVAAFPAPVGGVVAIPADVGVTHYVRVIMVSTSETWSVATQQYQAVPLAPPEPTPVAPEESPTPEPLGNVGSILVRLPTVPVNESPFEVDIYIGTAAQMIGDPPMLPLDATTFHGTASGSVYPIERMPDGSALQLTDPPDDPNGDPVTYYVVAYARNAAGAAAAPSAAVEASVRPADVDEQAFGLLYAGKLSVTRLEGGTFNLSEGEVNRIEAVNLGTGAKVGMSNLDGFYVYGPTPEGGGQGQAYVEFPIDGAPNIISGTLRAKVLETEAATLSGITEVSPGSALVLGGQVQPPQSQPSVNANWHTVQHQHPAHYDPAKVYGLTRGHDGRWYTAWLEETAGESSSVLSFNENGTYGGAKTLIGGTDAYGVVYTPQHGGRYVVLVRLRTTGDWAIEQWTTGWSYLNRTTVLLEHQVGSNAGYNPALGWDHARDVALICYTRKGSVWVTDVLAYTLNANGTSTNDAPSGTEYWTAPSAYEYRRHMGAVIGGVDGPFGSTPRFIFRSRGTADDEFQVFYQTQSSGSGPLPDEQFPGASNTQSRGACYDPTTGRLWSLDQTGRRFRYEDGDSMWTDLITSVARTNGSKVITSAGGAFTAAKVGYGAAVSGPGIPSGTIVASRDSDTQITLSKNATSTGTAVVDIVPSAVREVQYAWHTGTRTVAAARTAASPVLQSAAVFLPGDVGKTITGTGIPNGTTVLSYQNPSQVTLSQPATDGAPTTGNVTIARTSYTTTPSPKGVVLDQPKRSRLTITIGTIPLGAQGDANPIGARLYLGRGLNAPNTQMIREKTLWTPENVWSQDSAVAPETTAENPALINEFPLAAPSEFRSTSGGVYIRSNGDGSLGTAGLLADVHARGLYVGAILMYDGVIDSNTPTGGQKGPPPGFLWCNGDSVSRLLFAELHAFMLAQGYPHGPGDGALTFGIPDYRNRFPIGVGEGYANRLGHTDGVSNPVNRTTYHEHASGSLSVGNRTLNKTTDVAGGGVKHVLTQETHNHPISGTTGWALSGGDFPHLGVNFLIATGKVT